MKVSKPQARPMTRVEMQILQELKRRDADNQERLKREDHKPRSDDIRNKSVWWLVSRCMGYALLSTSVVALFIALHGIGKDSSIHIAYLLAVLFAIFFWGGVV